MVSACFERAGFSLYGRDWIGCVPGRTLISKSMQRNPVWTRKYICISADTVDSARVPTGSV